MEETIFWQKHLNWFFPFVSEFYPLNKFQLLEYEDILDWDRVKSNPFIKWTEQTKTCFDDKLKLAKKVDYLNLEIYYDKPAIPKYPSADEIYLRDDEFSKGKLFWRDIKFGIGNIGLAGEDDVVMKLIWHFKCSNKLNGYLFKDRPLDIKYLERITEPNDWKLLSRHFGLDWSFELLHQFEEYWDTEQLIFNHTAFNYCLKDDLDDEFIKKVLG